MSVRTIFLDIDGVLNSGAWYAARPQCDERTFDHELDPAAIARLNRIVSETTTPDVTTNVVVSSTWRCIYPFDELRDGLYRCGVRAPVIGVTPDLRGRCNRGAEIDRWLRVNDRYASSFVILDDDADMGSLMPYLVKTKFATGLRDEHVDRAIAMLLGKLEAA